MLNVLHTPYNDNLSRIRKMSKVLVVCAHADDEILGCGATMVKHVTAGDEVLCLILNSHNLASGDMSSYAQEAAEIIGYELLLSKSFYDNQFDKEPLLKVIQNIENLTKGYLPDIVYTHYEHDLNIDHRIIFQSVLTAFRPNGKTSILSFEVPSSTDWASETMLPNLYVDVTDTIEQKLTTMQIYSTEVREYPHPRSLEAIRTLAKFRGIQSGLQYAEAFKVIRMIV